MRKLITSWLTKFTINLIFKFNVKITPLRRGIAINYEKGHRG